MNASTAEKCARRTRGTSDKLMSRVRDERGASTLMVVIFGVMFLLAGGLVIDGGYALSAKREALGHAEQAARAGADALDQGSMRDDIVAVNPDAARAAAKAYLAQVGATGTVLIDGGEVEVTVNGHQNTTILTIIGVGSIPISATATAESISEDDSPLP